MGRVSRPNMTRLLRRDKERYKQLFEGSDVVRQQVKPMKVRIRTKDLTGNHKPTRRRPRRPQRKRRMSCEVQFPNEGHRRKVFGRTLKQLGVYEEIVKSKRR